MLSEKYSVIIPAYNEVESIEKTIMDLDDVMRNYAGDDGYEILVVDDGSTDGTAEAISHRDVKLVRHGFNRGYGQALKTGIMHSSHEIIVIVDADGTYPIKDIPSILEPMGTYDMVVGARVGDRVKMPLLRRLPKFFLTKLANYLVGTKIPDLNSGMRAFKRSVVEEFLNITPSGFSFTATITMAMYCHGCAIKFVPITYHKRTGRSKIRPMRDTMNFLSVILRTMIYFEPLKFFIPLSLMLIAAAFGIFFYSYFFMTRVLDTTVVVLFIGAIQIGVLGLLADLIDRKSGR